MPKIIVSIDGVVIKDVQLTKDRTTLGRRPYNDVVIDNLAVSGEHAVMQMSGNEMFLEDLNSTNGTYVNGKAIKRQALNNGDTIEIGKYKIRYVYDGAGTSAVPERATVVNSGQQGEAQVDTTGAASASAMSGAIKVMSGAAAGREVPLLKVVTTIGKPGVAVAAITRRPHGFVIAVVEGTVRLSVNGAPVGADAVHLHHGDLIELAGTQMQFIQR